MSFLWMIFIGFVIGLVARAVMPGADPAGVIMTVLLGIAGSLLAGYFGQVAGLYLPGEPAGFLAAIVGAMVVLFLYRVSVRQRPGI